MIESIKALVADIEEKVGALDAEIQKVEGAASYDLERAKTHLMEFVDAVVLHADNHPNAIPKAKPAPKTKKSAPKAAATKESESTGDAGDSTEQASK